MIVHLKIRRFFYIFETKLQMTHPPSTIGCKMGDGENPNQFPETASKIRRFIWLITENIQIFKDFHIYDWSAI